MISFHDPRASVGTVFEPYTLAHHFEPSGKGTTVGLLANGFPDSDNFLHRIGEALKQRLPDIEVKFWNKGNPTIGVPDKVLNEIKSHCQIAIAAYGH